MEINITGLDEITLVSDTSNTVEEQLLKRWNNAIIETKVIDTVYAGEKKLVVKFTPKEMK